MSVASDSLPAPDPAAADQVAGTSWDRLEVFLEAASERLNPILVKEARQALKSRQFIITFTLLLICGWGWSLLGIALLTPGVYYAPGARFMLIGYYLVLAVPLLVVVPFAAFRSLASEREDGTYELLSITTLSARQIITGKLGSAVLQMLVYYSALSPCVAFTYLLRGIDIVTILLILTYTFLASLLFSVAGLLVATISRSRHWQVFLSVVLLGALALAAILWSQFIVLFVMQTPEIDEPYFWLGNLCALTFYLSFMVLLVQAGAGQLSFASENRSTRLRAIMLVQQLLFIGWMTFFWFDFHDDDVLYGMMFVGGMYWMAMGAMLSGELALLSPRARRDLPQSFLGRMTFSWFIPGSGTGYFFALQNLAVLSITVITLGITATILGFDGRPREGGLYWLAVLCLAYAALYLGLGRLLVLMMRLMFPAGMVISLITQAVLLSAGSALPFFLQVWLQQFQEPDYSALQFPNWAWTLVEAADNDIAIHIAAPLAVFALALLMVFVNGLLTLAEVRYERAPVPDRVREDEGQPDPQTPAPPKSPFDD